MEKDREFDVGDQVQITQGSNHWVSAMDEHIGKIATITKVEPGSLVDQIYRIDLDKGEWRWVPQSGHFIHAPQHGLDQKDELLYRAEQMFPVGTKFLPAHQIDEHKISEGTHCIITDDTSFEFDSAGNIYAKAGGRRWFMSEVTKYGNTSYDRLVYLARNKKWAHIYSAEPQEDDKPIPADELMIIEAKKRYPVGTRFYPAHQDYDVGDSEYCIMTDDTKIEVGSDGTIYASINGSWWDHSSDPKYGNTSWNRVLRDSDDGKWATILKTAPEFLVNDQVIIIRGHCNWASEMDRYIGKMAVLTNIHGTGFRIDLDGGEWFWSYKDGHFRKPTSTELYTMPIAKHTDLAPTVEQTPKMEFEYNVGDEVYLTKYWKGVQAQTVTISSLSSEKDTPHYGLKGWVGLFPEELLEPTVEESQPEQDLLAMAFVKYPVGTKYKCAAGGEDVYTVEKQSFTLHNPTTVYAEPYKGCLSKNGVWAEIIEPVVKPTLEFKPVTSDSYIKQQLDKVTVTSADVEAVRASIEESHEKLRAYAGDWIIKTPEVEELPTFRVKRVSFNRI